MCVHGLQPLEIMSCFAGFSRLGKGESIILAIFAGKLYEIEKKMDRGEGASPQHPP